MCFQWWKRPILSIVITRNVQNLMKVNVSLLPFYNSRLWKRTYHVGTFLMRKLIAQRVVFKSMCFIQLCIFRGIKCQWKVLITTSSVWRATQHTASSNLGSERRYSRNCKDAEVHLSVWDRLPDITSSQISVWLQRSRSGYHIREASLIDCISF